MIAKLVCKTEEMVPAVDGPGVVFRATFESPGSTTVPKLIINLPTSHFEVGETYLMEIRDP